MKQSNVIPIFKNGENTELSSHIVITTNVKESRKYIGKIFKYESFYSKIFKHSLYYNTDLRQILQRLMQLQM